MRGLLAAVAIAVACLFMASFANARPIHHHHRAHHHHRHAHVHHHRFRRAPMPPARPLIYDDVPHSSKLVSVALRYVGARKFTPFAGAWCRDALNVWLRKAGLRTDGSRLALAALHLGPRLRSPFPGSIGVMGRRGGGHDVVVIGRSGNRVEAVSPNWGHMVKLVTYPIRRFIAFIQPVRG